HPITPSPFVAVIGAGMVGAAVAHRLVTQGAPVILLDGAAPGSGATAASLGVVSAREQLPRAFFELSAAAMEEYRRFAWSLAPAPWYHAEGTLVTARDPARAAALEEQVHRLEAWGYAAELLPTTAALTELEPGASGGILAAGADIAWFPREAWVDALAMTRRLVAATQNAGGRILAAPEREVVAIGLEG